MPVRIHVKIGPQSHDAVKECQVDQAASVLRGASHGDLAAKLATSGWVRLEGDVAALTLLHDAL